MLRLLGKSVQIQSRRLESSEITARELFEDSKLNNRLNRMRLIDLHQRLVALRVAKDDLQVTSGDLRTALQRIR